MSDLSSRIDKLQARLSEVNDTRLDMDMAPLNPTLNFGSGRRPNLCEFFSQYIFYQYFLRTPVTLI